MNNEKDTYDNYTLSYHLDIDDGKTFDKIKNICTIEYTVVNLVTKYTSSGSYKSVELTSMSQKIIDLFEFLINNENKVFLVSFVNNPVYNRDHLKQYLIKNSMYVYTYFTNDAIVNAMGDSYRVLDWNPLYNERKLFKSSVDQRTEYKIYKFLPYNPKAELRFASNTTKLLCKHEKEIDYLRKTVKDLEENVARLELDAKKAKEAEEAKEAEKTKETLVRAAKEAATIAATKAKEAVATASTTSSEKEDTGVSKAKEAIATASALVVATASTASTTASTPFVNNEYRPSNVDTYRKKLEEFNKKRAEYQSQLYKRT